MDDLFDVLTSSGKRKYAAPEFIGNLLHNPSMLGLAVGAAVGAASQFVSSTPNKQTGISPEQRLFRRAERVADMDARSARAEGREPTMRESLTSITAKPMSRLADYAAKHPLRASVLSAAVGAKAGHSIGKLFGT